MTTRLGLYGGPSRNYGTFSGKTEAVGAKDTAQLTRLGLSGTPAQLYGDFDPKAAAAGGGKSTDQLTRLGLYGGPRFLYGDFSGKTEGDTQVKGGGKAKGRKRVYEEKGYFLEDEKYESDAALAYEVTAELQYAEATKDIDGVDVVHERPLRPTRDDISITLAYPTEVESEALRDEIRAKEDQVLKILLMEFEMELKKIEEELFFMVLALAEDNF